MRSLNSFPRHPQDIYEQSDVTSFEEDTPGPNYRQDSLKVMFRFVFPKLEDPQVPGPFQGSILLPEEDSFGDHVLGLVRAYAISRGPGRAWIQKALAYGEEDHAELVMITKNGRILGIPLRTKVGSVWAGTKWPRAAPSPYKLLRKPPADDPKRVDGLVFVSGHSLLVYVVPTASVPTL